jgi:polygalacturonase
MKPRLPFLLAAAAILAGCATVPPSSTAAAPAAPLVATPAPIVAEPGDVAPAQPVIPARAFDLRDFGAVANIAIDNAAAFKRAVAAVNAAGGGTLTVPPGVFRTGPFALCSGINLHLEAGATILFSPNSADYAGGGRSRQLSVNSAHDVLISGAGTIDGHGDGWWGAANALRDPVTGKQFPGAHPPRPTLLGFSNCQRIRVEGISLVNSPSLNFGTTACDDVTVNGITLINPPNSPNTDGIDPGGGSRRIVIAHCHIDTGDDDICLKGGIQDMLVTDCAIFHGHGVSIGSNVDQISNLTVRRCNFEGTATGIRIKCYAGRGGKAENLVYKDLTMKNVQVALSINSNYQGTTIDTEGIGIDHVPANPENANSTKWSHILIRNVQATGCTLTAGLIVAVPEVPVEDVTLEHISIDAPTGLRIGYTKGITLHDVHVKVKSGEPIDGAYTVDGLVRQ